MAGNIGHNRLKSFVERIEEYFDETALKYPGRALTKEVMSRPKAPAHHDWRPGPKNIVAERHEIEEEEAAFWLEICGRLCRIGGADDFDHHTRRGYTIACRLLGLSWNDCQKAIGDVRQIGGAASAPYWSGRMAKADPRFVGHVYSAHVLDNPSVVKIGFSCTPEKRMKSLSRQHGHMVLDVVLQGTMLHEWALHQLICKPVAPEWYPAKEIPEWLLPAELKQGAA